LCHRLLSFSTAAYTYTVKVKYMSWDNQKAWVKTRLYLDLMKDPKVELDDGEMGIK